MKETAKQIELTTKLFLAANLSLNDIFSHAT
jgi:hypothetical protein